MTTKHETQDAGLNDECLVALFYKYLLVRGGYSREDASTRMIGSWILILLLLLIARAADDETCAADGTCPSGVEYVPVSWGQVQQVTGAKAQDTLQAIERTRKYMTEQVFVDDRFALVRNDCKLKSELCSYWAVMGKCEGEMFN
jgi:hypothetical protein